MGDFQKVVIIDGKGHVFGRLASIVAKQLLEGQKVVVVRCEEVVMTGMLIRNRLKYLTYLQKCMRSNPSRGPYHFRAPSRMLYRCIRGMIPHKLKRGKYALERLKVFDGCPSPYDTKKKMVVPEALRLLRVKPVRKVSRLGDIAKLVGWNYGDIVNTLEKKRIARGEIYYARKKKLAALKRKAAETKTKELEPINKKLAEFGY
eukprot:NODE_1871_length_709_cov_65.541237_g1821_i0.p1 GENE.NODE_1871_length_709_cov_65.541237_g1821_i0~~NODE_1871_length_709_cov_65.541237_g1821_i0.p1  ORF type:complete len:227 (-),score=67.31 NODE_1871_length_709_cov_65.541237_g1821_i0:28-636(-)